MYISAFGGVDIVEKYLLIFYNMRDILQNYSIGT